MTRLIVSLHHLIANPSLVWRSGVIFERQGTRAEVIEDYPRRKITVRFELTEIAAAGDIRDRVFPIILDDANIYEALGRLAYIRHWENRRKELDAEMKLVSGDHLTSIRDELDLCAKTRATIDGIMDLLAGMNTLPPEQHRGSSFLELVELVRKRLSQ